MKTLAAVAVLGIVLFPLPTLAEDDATACKPDVFRLCSAAIPWKDRIVACLHENRRKLSPACYQVFNRKPSKYAKPPKASGPGPLNTSRAYGKARGYLTNSRIARSSPSSVSGYIRPPMICFIMRIEAVWSH